MLTLKQQILKKAKIMNEYRHPTKQNKSLVLQKLKQIKKQFKLSDEQTEKNTQTIFTQRVTEVSYTQELYFMTFTIMKAFDKQFQFLPQQKDIYANFIEMNINFYRKQEAYIKAEQISRTYRKKLLQKNMIFPTLLGWLFEWTKKKFQFFLKETIKSLQRDIVSNSHIQSVTLNTKNQKTHIEQIYRQQFQLNNTLKLKKLEIAQKSLKINLCQSNPEINSKKLDENQINFLVSELSQYKLGASQKLYPDQIAICKSAIQISQQNEKVMPFKNYSKISLSNFQEDKSNQQYINKEAFYGCFYDEMKKYYKQMSCIEDIDHYYLKTIRKTKQSKKEMIQQKTQQVIQALIKNQSDVTNSIKNYYQSYSSKFPQFKKRQNKQKNQNKIKQIQTTNLLSKNYFFNKKNSLARAKFLKSQTSVQQRVYSVVNQNQIEKSDKNDKVISEEEINYKKSKLKDQKSKRFQCIRLPMVTNPQDINKPFQYQKQVKKEKNKNLKGLIRYKFINKIKQPYADNQQTQFQMEKSQDFQLGNIRKILKQRLLLKRKNEQNLYCNSSLNIQTDSSEKVIERTGENNKMVSQLLKNNRLNNSSKVTQIDLKQMCANISSIHQQMSSNYFQIKNRGKAKLIFPEI